MTFSRCLLIGLCWGALTAQGQVTAPSPTISSISPLGGRPGSTVDLVVKGTELDEAQSVLLSSLRGSRSMRLPLVQVPEKKGVLVLNLPAEAVPDLYDFRLVTRYGVSNPRVFQIGSAEVIVSPGTNVKSETALPVTSNSAIHGVFKSAVPHWFRLQGKKGQRVLGTFTGAAFEVRTSLVGSVYDLYGRELARLRDGLLDVVLPADASYLLKLHDLMYGAGDDYGYRFTLTTGAVVWAASKAGLFGWNLPGGQVMQHLRVNRGQPLEYVKADAQKLISESPIPPLQLPEIMEASDSLPEKPEPLRVGQSYGGWFPASGVARQFDLSFQKGARFIIELASQQLGYATDPTLLIELLNGESLTVQADLADPAVSLPTPCVRLTMLDPVYAYEAKAEGVFRLSVSDSSNAANGRRLPYELRILRVGESSHERALAMEARLPPAAAAGPHGIPSANVWRGGISAWEVFIPNRTAMSEAVEINLTNLPSGVTSLGGVVGQGQSIGYIGLRAAPDAPAGAEMLSGISRTANLSWPVKDSGREPLITRMAGPPVIGIVPDAAPILIEQAVPGILEVAVDAKLVVPLKVTRHSSCTEAIKLRVLGFGDPAKAPEVSLAAKAAEGKLMLDLKTLKLAAGDYGCILQGTAKMPFQRQAEQVAAAQASARKAAQAHQAATKALEEANTALKALKPEDTVGMEAQKSRVKELTAAISLAVKAKADADKAAKDITTKNATKETTFLIHSAPIRFRVTPPVKK
jgi:hypothetical protein